MWSDSQSKVALPAIGTQQLKDAQGRVVEGAGGHTFPVVLPEVIADTC